MPDVLSPAFLASVVVAVKQALSAKQPTSIHASSSVAGAIGGVPATFASSLQSQASALAASGVGFLPVPASIAVTVVSTLGRPNFVVPSFGVSFWLFPGLLPGADVEVCSDFFCGITGLWRVPKGLLVRRVLGSCPAAAINCLQGTVPSSNCCPCLGPPCSGHHSELLLCAIVYAHKDQRFQDGPIQERLLCSHWPWQASSGILCAVQAMMSYLALTDWLKRILASAQMPGNFSSHSFRIGAATIAACNGVPDHLIQTMDCWSSNAYQLYIRTPADSLAALSHILALAPSTVSCRAPFSPS